MRAAGRAEPAGTPVPDRASGDSVAFERFVAEAGPRLGRALAAAYGFEDERDATAEALAARPRATPPLSACTHPKSPHGMSAASATVKR
jgi:hypothetical protein